MSKIITVFMLIFLTSCTGDSGTRFFNGYYDIVIRVQDDWIIQQLFGNLTSVAIQSVNERDLVIDVINGVEVVQLIEIANVNDTSIARHAFLRAFIIRGFTVEEAVSHFAVLGAEIFDNGDRIELIGRSRIDFQSRQAELIRSEYFVAGLNISYIEEEYFVQLDGAVLYIYINYWANEQDSIDEAQNLLNALTIGG